jgi:hypothetical protein
MVLPFGMRIGPCMVTANNCQQLAIFVSFGKVIVNYVYVCYKRTQTLSS